MVERSRRRHDVYDNTLTKMIATTAVLAAMAALQAGHAGAVLLDTEGDSAGGSTAVAVASEPSAIPYLSHGIGVDETLYDETATPQGTVEQITIPYLSHGIGVDESQFSGEPSLGLTGDSALTRVSAPEPEGLTGDSPRTRGDIATASSGGTFSSNEDDWTWVGLGSGLAALFAAAVGALYLSARHRGRVALP
jgi:hypothetical protein